MFVEKQWCLTVSCPRLRCVLCPRAGACFFSFRGFRLVISPRCGGGFFAGFASGFRWCLAVLSRSPGGCCFGRVWARLRCVLCPRAGACFFSFMGFRLVTSARCGGGFFAGFASGFRWCLAVLSRSPGGCCFGRVWARLRCVLCPRAGACFFSFMGFRLVTSARCGGGFFAGFASGFRWCLAVLSRSPGGCCFGRVWARLRCVLCPRAGACFFSFMGFRLVTSARCGGGFFAGFASGFRWCLAVLSRSPGGCCFGRVWARLRCVLCPRAGACFFSFMGFRLVTSARCGGGFFAGFASGFRWCLAVLSRSPGGCCFGRVWARLRCVLCPRAGACFFSFMGFRLVTSARCGGGFFAGFASGFRWCLAVLSRSPGGCCFGRVWARLRCVLCPRAGACFFSFMGFRLVTSARCGGGFFAGFASGFRWCLAVLSRSPGGCCFGRVWARLRCVLCPRAGACFFSFMGFRLVTSARCGGGFFAGFASGFRWCLAVLSLGCVAFCVHVLGPVSSPLWVSDLSLRHAAGEGFLLGLRPDLGGVWLF